MTVKQIIDDYSERMKDMFTAFLNEVYPVMQEEAKAEFHRANGL